MKTVDELTIEYKKLVDERREIKKRMEAGEITYDEAQVLGVERFKKIKEIIDQLRSIDFDFASNLMREYK